MTTGQQEGQNGKRGRDAALTWDVPPPLEEADKVAPAGRPAFSAVAGRHLEALVTQLLEAEGVQASTWAPLVCQLAQQAADALSPTAAVAHGKLDPRYYIKVKRLLSVGGDPADSTWVQGVVCRKSLAHKRMRSSIAQPRIMLLAGGVEPQLLPAAPGTTASKLSSFGALLDQEQQYLAAAVERISAFNPDVLLVERSVGRYAQELLLGRDISLVLNVKCELLERLARCTGAQVAPSLDQLTSHCIGFCKGFEVESLQPAATAATAAVAIVATAMPPGAVSTEVSPRTAELPEGHLVADAVALASASLRKASGGVQPGGPRALMIFHGCPRQLGSTILLRGSDAAELRRIKRVTRFAAYTAYWGILEVALLSDQLAAAASTVLPGGGQPDAVAGLADAVASTSYLATAEARARQAVLSASAHVSVMLERGTVGTELDLPELADDAQQQQLLGAPGASSSSTAAWDEAAPDSPASSNSTNMWVVPAEAGAATFTVSGSHILEAEAEELNVEQQQQSELGAAPPPGRIASSAAFDTPGSPQDPLHEAAKELALRQLQLTGSEPPSPEATTDSTLQPDLEDTSPYEQQQQQQQDDSSSRDGESMAAQLSHRTSVVSSQQLAAAEVVEREPSGLASTAPGAMVYHTQQLWLSISCKNPAKGILCEPSHSHCMEFYADTDLPLAAFLSAAAPPNRKCPHPQCGDGAPLHLRSFMHGNGLVTLSSVRLPAGKELPDGRVWLWLRPAGSAGAGSEAAAAAARRVPLSPVAACLSFAHLLSLLLDARHLSLGGLSLQRDYVRYLGAGSTLLCLHYSPTVPYEVHMPPRHVELLAEAEEEWLQEEIKQLTEEADEAFGAIEYALGEQLRALEGGATEPEPEFAQTWLDTLADTRTSFLDTVQDTITQLDGSPCTAGESEQQQAGRAVGVVWELNRLRSLLAAVVLQWATCLHEGTPSNHVAPPSGTSAIATALQNRRAVAHSNNISTEGLVPGSAAVAAVAGAMEATMEAVEAPSAAQAELLSSPFSQQVEARGAGTQQQHLEAQALAPVKVGGMQRKDSTASLGRQFIEAADAAGPPQQPTMSEFNFGAPSLQAGDDGGGGSLAASPQGSMPSATPALIPTGLVARYIAMFDQSRVGGGGSSSTSPIGNGARSQRTRDWVQTSSPMAADVDPEAAAAAALEAAAVVAGVSSSRPGGAAGLAQEAGSSSGGDSISGTSGGQGDLAAGRLHSQQTPPPPPPQPLQQGQGQGQGQRPSFFRLDLTNPDPELVKALTPKNRSTADEAEVEAPPSSSSSRLEQLSARLGRMSLSKSFTERRRSGGAHLLHLQSADQPALLQHLESVVEQQALHHPLPLRPPGDVQLQQQEKAAGVQAAGAGGDAFGQGPAAAAEEGLAAAESEVQLGLEPSGKGSVSHWDEWSTLLDDAAPEGPQPPPGEGGGSGGELGALLGSAGIPSPPYMLRSASDERHKAIARLQEALMPPDLAVPGGMQEEAAAPAEEEHQPCSVAAAVTVTAAAASASAAAAPAAAAAAPAAAAIASVPVAAAPPPPVRTLSIASSRSLTASVPASTPGGFAPSPPPEKAPNKLLALLGKLRSELQPGHMPLTAGKVELSGRALLPSGAGGVRVAVFDDEPTSVIAYFLATKEYQLYLHDAVATILFGEVGQRSSGPGGASTAGNGAAAGSGTGELGTAAVPGSWQPCPASPRSTGGSMRRSSLVPALRQQQQTSAAGAAASISSAAATAAPASDVQQPEAGVLGGSAAGAGAGAVPSPPTSSHAVSQGQLAAEQSGDWQVLFHESQLDCQLTLEDPSPGMPWGRAKFQIIAYYAPQFAELRRRCVAGGEAAFLASISRCRKWASCGGKSAVYFARSCDKRYIVKQLSRSERQSFLEFAPDYFRYVATMLHRGQDTCLAKILGVYQVSVQYTGGRGAPAAPPFGGKEGVMDLLIMENVFYGRDAHVSRIYDLKGSQRDRYVADNSAAAGAVLLDENLKELNLASPTLVGPRAFARLQRALWSDTSFLSSLGVMDYSLLVGVDKRSQELVVGVIDYIRQYTWDKQVETWVKKSGILGGAGKDPTVISPKQYSRRFRIAMSSYLTIVPTWEAPEPPLDPDAV